LATPPWLEHEPLCVLLNEYDPSLHLAVAPAGAPAADIAERLDAAEEAEAGVPALVADLAVEAPHLTNLPLASLQWLPVDLAVDAVAALAFVAAAPALVADLAVAAGHFTNLPLASLQWLALDLADDAGGALESADLDFAVAAVTPDALSPMTKSAIRDSLCMTSPHCFHREI
jgi:hypothetical protein